MYLPSMRRGPGAGAGRWETADNPQLGERKVDESPPIVAVMSTLSIVSMAVGALHTVAWTRGLHARATQIPLNLGETLY